MGGGEGVRRGVGGGATTALRFEPKAGCQARLHLATLNEPTAHFLSLPAIHQHTVTGKFI